MAEQKVRGWRECERLVDSIVNGLHGVTAYRVSLDTTKSEAEDEAQIIIGITTSQKDYLDFEMGTEWLSTASVDDIEQEIKALIKDQDERGKFTWIKPRHRTATIGEGSSIGAN